MADLGDIKVLPGNPDTSDHVLATYREIAARFELGSSTAARVKAKRQITRGVWELEPSNHPADPVRIKIPRQDWEGPPDTSRAKRRDTGHTKLRDTPGIKVPDTPSIKAAVSAFSAALSLLSEQLERERDRADTAEAQLVTAQARLAAATSALNTAQEEAATLRAAAPAPAALQEIAHDVGPWLVSTCRSRPARYGVRRLPPIVIGPNGRF